MFDGGVIVTVSCAAVCPVVLHEVTPFAWPIQNTAASGCVAVCVIGVEDVSAKPRLVGYAASAAITASAAINLSLRSVVSLLPDHSRDRVAAGCHRPVENEIRRAPAAAAAGSLDHAEVVEPDADAEPLRERARGPYDHKRHRCDPQKSATMFVHVDAAVICVACTGRNSPGCTF